VTGERPTRQRCNEPTAHTGDAQTSSRLVLTVLARTRLAGAAAVGIVGVNRSKMTRWVGAVQVVIAFLAVALVVFIDVVLVVAMTVGNVRGSRRED